jgi:hypothetical protein
VLELYFILYRVPKMMTRLARERNRSALGWSLMGIAVWIGAEILVVFGLALLYGIGSIVFDWPMPIPDGVKLIAYILALVAALGSVTMLSRILGRVPKEDSFVSPPPPPDFHSESNRVG